MTTVVITGANGYIGSNLARELSKSGDNICIFVRKQSNLWRLRDVISKFAIEIVDVLDKKAIQQKINKIKPDIVYHCAVYGVHPFKKDLTRIIQTNIQGSVNLLQSLVEYNDLKKFINIGSVSEYGPKLKAAKENDVVNPNTVYGVAKVAQTNFTQYFTLSKKLPSVTCRIFTPYGMYEEPGRLIPDIMIALIRKKPLFISAPKAKRDFVFIEDVIKALISAERKSRMDGEIFNIGSGKEYSVEEIIDIVQRVTHTDLKISFNNRNQREYDKRGIGCFANIEKAKKLLNWEPNYSIEEGLKKTHQWYLKNISLYS